jgi:hypothetical protein
MFFTTSYLACYINISYDIVYFLRHLMFEVRAPGQFRRWQRSTCAESILRIVYYFFAAQLARRHVTRACPFVDTQNGHGHMGKR